VNPVSSENRDTALDRGLGLLQTGRGLKLQKGPSQEVKEILADVEAVRQQRGLSKRQLANILGIPFNTLRAWFQNRGAKAPSNSHLTKLHALVDESTRSRAQWDEIWKRIREWWRVQHRYPSLQQLAEELGWTSEGLRACLENESKPPRLVVERLAQLLHIQTLPTIMPAEEALRRAERLKHLLIMLAEDLAWFRDGPAEFREVYRSELDPFDTGYVSSLLTMLFSEDKFHRWLEVTTNRFNYFRAKGNRR